MKHDHDLVIKIPFRPICKSRLSQNYHLSRAAAIYFSALRDRERLGAIYHTDATAVVAATFCAQTGTNVRKTIELLRNSAPLKSSVKSAHLCVCGPQCGVHIIENVLDGALEIQDLCGTFLRDGPPNAILSNPKECRATT